MRQEQVRKDEQKGLWREEETGRGTEYDGVRASGKRETWREGEDKQEDRGMKGKEDGNEGKEGK